MSERSGPLSGRTIVLGVTGSIAAYKAVEVASRLVQAGATVRPVMTRAATEFVGPATFRGVTGHEPLVDIWAPDGEHAEPHVALGREADLMLVDAGDRVRDGAAGARHHRRLRHADGARHARAAAGRAGDGRRHVGEPRHAGQCAHAAGARRHVPRARRGPPRLRRDGRWPAHGAARDCRPHQGRGRDASTGRSPAPRIAVTAGGTREPVDPVRFVGNRSSGKMGYAVAEAARDRGAEVVLITSAELAPPAGVRIAPVETAQEMLEAVQEHVPACDALIMAAAVADYRPLEAATEKAEARRPRDVGHRPRPQPGHHRLRHGRRADQGRVRRRDAGPGGQRREEARREGRAPHRRQRCVGDRRRLRRRQQSHHDPRPQRVTARISR